MNSASFTVRNLQIPLPEASLLSGILLFSPLIEGGTTHHAIMVIRLLILALAGVWLFRLLQIRQLIVLKDALTPPILALIALSAISTATSPYFHQSFQWLMTVVLYAALLYLLVELFTAWQQLIPVCIALLAIMALIEGTSALAQGILIGKLRPAGTFFNPNFLSIYLGAILTVMFGILSCLKWKPSSRARSLIAYGFRSKDICQAVGDFMVKHDRSVKYFLLTSCCIAGAGSILAGSRGGMLATVVGIIIVSMHRKGKKLAVLPIAVLVFALTVPNPYRDRVVAEHIANPLSYARTQIWQQSIAAIMDVPLGVGLGLYQYVFPRYSFPVEGEIARYGKIAQTAHNEYLQIGVELGLAGLLVFAWGITVFGRTARVLLQARLRRWQRGVVVGWTAGVAAILVHAGVDSTFHEPAVVIVLLTGVASIIASTRVSERPPQREVCRHVRRRWAWGVLGMLFLTATSLQVMRVGIAWMKYEAGKNAQAAQQLESAVQSYHEAIDIDGTKALYHSALASAFFQLAQQGRDYRYAETAVSELRTAIVLNPIDGRLHGLLGYLCASIGSSSLWRDVDPKLRLAWLEQALGAYQAASLLEPYSAFHQFEMGRVYFALGMREEAITRAKQAVRIEPNFLPAREWLAKVYAASDKEEEKVHAIDEYQEIRTRLERYAAVPKDPMEQRFMRVDLSSLAQMVQKMKSRV